MPKPAHLPTSRRERRSAENRERLFRAALQKFAQNGYAETTIEDITEAADLGKGTFFNYFPSKEHILMAFGEMQIGKLEAFVAGVQGSAQPMPEILHALVARMTEEPIRNPEIVRALIQANLTSAAVRGEMARLHEKNRELLARLIRHGQQRGEVRTDLAPEEIAQAWRQMIFGTLLFWSLSGDDSLPQRMESSVGVLWNGIAARPREGALNADSGKVLS